MTPNWEKLVFGKYDFRKIAGAVADTQWQRFRASIKGTNLTERYKLLEEWVESHDNNRRAQIQVTNYVNALKRGGAIKS